MSTPTKELSLEVTEEENQRRVRESPGEFKFKVNPKRVRGGSGPRVKMAQVSMRVRPRWTAFF